MYCPSLVFDCGDLDSPGLVACQHAQILHRGQLDQPLRGLQRTVIDISTAKYARLQLRVELKSTAESLVTTAARASTACAIMQLPYAMLLGRAGLVDINRA